MCWLCGQPNKDIKKLREDVMARLDDVLAAIAAEKEQVRVAFEDAKTLIQSLKDQIAAGTAATSEDLDMIKAAVENIFNPEPPAPPAE
jgi:hypothetical protein